MSFDVLQDKIRAMKNPTVVGLDPKPEYVPPQMRKECYDQYGETLEGQRPRPSTGSTAA